MNSSEKPAAPLWKALHEKTGKAGVRFLLMMVLASGLFFGVASKPDTKNGDRELRFLLDWFRNNPPKADGSNFQMRWEKTVLLDKYGWELSNNDWNNYRSAWNNDPVKVSGYENANPILEYLRLSVQQSVQEIKNTKLSHGAVIWKLYNMGYVIKTREACFGIDLVFPGSKELVDVLDFAIVSHVHGDHFDKNFTDTMVAQGKMVYSPFYKPGTVIDSAGEFRFNDVTVRFTMNMQGDVPVIVSQVDCGSSANHFTVYDIADARLLEELNPTRHVNLFLLHIANGLDVFDAVDKIKPDATVYDHVMELGHPIGKYRWSYDFTFDKISRQDPASSLVLTWGERIDIDQNGKIIQKNKRPALK